MNGSDKKQSFSFSYIDIFFLLLAGLVVSVFIGFLVEAHRENLGAVYQVELSAEVDGEMKHILPKKGEILFGEDGQSCGKILAVETEEKGNGIFLKIRCRMEGKEPAVGESITVETPTSIRSMKVDTVQPENAVKEGR